MTLNNTHRILAGTLALVLVAGLGTPAFAHPTAEQLFFTTFGGGQNVHSVNITYDGVVNIDDIFAVLGSWGPCPEL